MPKSPFLWHRCEDVNAVTDQVFSTVGAPTYTAGYFNNGIDAESVFDHIKCSYPQPANPTDGFTLECWIEFTEGKGVGSWQGWVMILDNGVDNTDIIRIEFNQSYAAIQVRQDSLNKVIYRYSGITYNAGETHHVLVQVDKAGGANNRVKLYYDGSFETPSSYVNDSDWDITDASLTFYIGGSIVFTPAATIFNLDNVKLWDYVKSEVNDRFDERAGMNDWAA
jgi:hypothetical protein